MTVVPLRWHGATRAARIREHVNARSRVWLRQWSSDPTHTCDARPVDAPSFGASGIGQRWYAAATESGALRLSVHDGAVEQLGIALAGAAAPDGHGLAASIGHRALTDLASQLIEAPGQGALSEVPAPGAGEMDTRHGFMSLAWRMGTVEVGIHLDVRLCDALEPRHTAPGPLEPRAQAIRQSDVALQVVLDLGSVPLANTTSLRVGDVFRTSTALDGVLRLQTGNGIQVAKGELMERDGARALRVK